MNNPRLVLALVALFAARGLVAATVTAELSADETSVGNPVQLQVRVDGTTNVILPDLNVDGLQAQQTGRSVQASIDVTRGRVVTSGVFFYTIVPQREGTFQIPALEVIVDGKKERTSSLTLVVRPGSAAGMRPAPGVPLPPVATTPRRPRPTDPADESKLAYAELIVPRQSVYAGELVPVEVRFSFSDRASFQLIQRDPQVSGEGFTVQKFSPPQQTQEEIGDSIYQVLSFKTAITAVKSGEMPLPKITLHVVARVPTRGPQGMDDVFSRFFGGQGMPGFSEDRQLDVTTAPKSIRVKALPVAGRPESFSGGVGEFTLAATASPLKAAPGDPVTLRTAITGRGNFDALGEPKLVDTDGWRVYPPTDRFEKSDEIGFTGTKTFETPIVAQTPQTKTPVAEFSYFDPVREKYVTLRSQPVAVDASAAPENPPVAADASVTPSPTATPAVEPKAGWLAPATARSWEPLARRPGFWIANGIAAAVLGALIAAIAVRRSRQGPLGHRAAAVRRRDRLVSELNRADLSDETYFAKLRDALSIQAELAGSSGPVEWLDRLSGQGRDTATLSAALARADEIHFSGGNAAGRNDVGERRAIASALREVFR